MVDQQPGGDESVQHLDERVLAHPYPPADWFHVGYVRVPENFAPVL